MGYLQCYRGPLYQAGLFISFSLGMNFLLTEKLSRIIIPFMFQSAVVGYVSFVKTLWLGNHEEPAVFASALSAEIL
jgi:uncharacterized membrane protein YdcZ (DUF606 family)